MESFNLPLFLGKTAPAIKITSHIGTERIELALHILEFRFQNPIFSLSLLQLFIVLRVLRVFEFYILNFSLNCAHFFDELSFFVQFFFGFHQLLVSET